jgi:hypothetical protein
MDRIPAAIALILSVVSFACFSEALTGVGMIDAHLNSTDRIKAILLPRLNFL